MTEDRGPILHGYDLPRGSGCTYTGPDDDNLCGAPALIHVLCSGDDELRSLPACLNHAFNALRVAVNVGGLDVHPYTGACDDEAADYVRHGGCDIELARSVADR